MTSPFHIPLTDAAATKRLGADLAIVLQPGMTLALSGDLGAGKTTLTQGLANGLGIGADVLSPTFALMSEYRDARIPLLHIDAYRLTGAADARQLGLDEYLDAGWALVVEWPENIEGALPEDRLHIRLDYDGESRTATATAGGEISGKILETWRARSGD